MELDPIMIIMYIDGASRGNPGPAAIGVVIETDYGAVIDMWGEFIGVATNNVAEYMALIKGLKRLIELSIKEAIVRSDSQLLINQLNGRYRVKSKNILPLYLEAISLCRDLTCIEFEYISREENLRADSLANKALDIRGRYPPIL